MEDGRWISGDPDEWVGVVAGGKDERMGGRIDGWIGGRMGGSALRKGIGTGIESNPSLPDTQTAKKR